MVRHIAVVAILLAALARPSFADVTGPALVIDGDTLVVADERIRLEGIDAPALRQNAPADDRLFALLREGRYVNVLSSRQMGKSSLVMRTAHRLKAEGVRVIYIDLASEIGVAESADAYYLGLPTK